MGLLSGVTKQHPRFPCLFPALNPLLTCSSVLPISDLFALG